MQYTRVLLGSARTDAIVARERSRGACIQIDPVAAVAAAASDDTFLESVHIEHPRAHCCHCRSATHTELAT